MQVGLRYDLIAAVVAQVPWFGDARTPGQILRQLLTVSTLKLVAAGIPDAVRGARGRPPYLVPIVGEPGQTALFTGPEVKTALEAKDVEGSLWRNRSPPVRVRTVALCARQAGGAAGDAAAGVRGPP